MTHGAPDWNKYRPNSSSFPVQDMAELAARLGSINTFDRRGDVFWMEDFSTGLVSWDSVETPAGDFTTTSPTYALSQGYSCKVIVGNTSGSPGGLYRYLPRPRSGYYGLEVSFTIRPNHDSFHLILQPYDGTNLWIFQLRYLQATTRLQYKDAAGVFQNLSPTMNLPTFHGLFHTVKLVCDPTEHTYQRAQLNDESFDLSDIPASSAAAATPPNIYLEFKYANASAADTIGYIDDVILTQDEP